MVQHLDVIETCQQLETEVGAHVAQNDYERAGEVDRRLARVMEHLLALRQGTAAGSDDAHYAR